MPGQSALLSIIYNQLASISAKPEYAGGTQCDASRCLWRDDASGRWCPM